MKKDNAPMTEEEEFVFTAIDEDDDGKSGFFSTHPLTRERIEAIRGGGG